MPDYLHDESSFPSEQKHKTSNYTDSFSSAERKNVKGTTQNVRERKSRIKNDLKNRRPCQTTTPPAQKINKTPSDQKLNETNTKLNRPDMKHRKLVNSTAHSTLLKRIVGNSLLSRINASRLVNIVEHLDRVGRKSLRVLKDVFLYLICLLILCTVIALKFLWHTFVFLLKLVLLLLVLIVAQ